MQNKLAVISMWFLPSQTAIKLLISAERKNCKVAIWTLDTPNVPRLTCVSLTILVNTRDAREFYLWDTYRMSFYPEKYS